jgi:subtilase family serine protease
MLSGLCAAPGAAAAATPLITHPIDDANTVRLAGNTRPEAIAANDRGAVDDGMSMSHLQLLLQRPAATEAALDRFIDALHNPASPSYQHWLTADQFGERFAAAPQDIAAVTGWLARHGFRVNFVAAGRGFIDFSGTAGQVRDTFHTEIHALEVGGVHHIANMSDPWIPAELRAVVAGIVSLNDFRPHAAIKPKPAYTVTLPYESYRAVVPADLAKIYNLTKLFDAGVAGKGETVTVVEDSDVYDTADWTTFRKTFGLSKYTSGTFKQVHPAPSSGGSDCSDPGVTGDEEEAIIDAEWASAAAPDAEVELAACDNTETNYGVLIALQNLVDSKSPPPILSMSYGECEAALGASFNLAFYDVYKQAVTEGISVFVSSGDEGAASCNADQADATYGIGVSGLASTPYNVAVGGTDFGDTYAGTSSTYWSGTNSEYYGSALSYVPEIPWNNSCASVLIANFVGYKTTYGSSGFCSSSLAENAGFLTTASGSGGPSGCAKGTPSTPYVVSGTCGGYAKPSWQALVGNPADKKRDIPDVSLFAANGEWSHVYVSCDSADAACSGAPILWSLAGGTSFATPIMAGIQALVDQHKGKAQGNPNTVYYKLAATEYGSGGSSECNSTSGNKAASSCIFYDVTLGDMDVNCSGTYGCYVSTGTYGVLSTKTGSYEKAYGATTGWDFATGIGTVNAYNLVKAW